MFLCSYIEGNMLCADIQQMVEAGMGGIRHSLPLCPGLSVGGDDAAQEA